MFELHGLRREWSESGLWYLGARVVDTFLNGSRMLFDFNYPMICVHMMLMFFLGVAISIEFLLLLVGRPVRQKSLAALIIVGNSMIYFGVPFFLNIIFCFAWGGFYLEYLPTIHLAILACFVLGGLVIFPWLIVANSDDIRRKIVSRFLLIHFCTMGIAGGFTMLHSSVYDSRYKGFRDDWPLEDVQVFYVAEDGVTLKALTNNGEEVLHTFRKFPEQLSFSNLDNGVLIFSNRDRTDSYFVPNVRIPVSDRFEVEGIQTVVGNHDYRFNLRTSDLDYPRVCDLASPLVNCTRAENFKVSDRYIAFRIHSGIFLYDLKEEEFTRIGTGLRLVCLLERNESSQPQRTSRGGNVEN